MQNFIFSSHSSWEDLFGRSGSPDLENKCGLGVALGSEDNNGIFHYLGQNRNLTKWAPSHQVSILAKISSL